jgi:hypothetical protein
MEVATTQSSPLYRPARARPTAWGIWVAMGM